MATNEKLAEPIINALIAILQVALPAALTKVSASYNDDVPLPNVEAANYYFGERLMFPEFPSIVLDFETAEIDAEAFSNTWAIYAHTISLDIIINSDDESILAHQLARYARALWEVLYANQAALPPGGSTAQALSVRPRTGLRSPLVPNNDAYLKGWRWLLEVQRQDDLT